MPIYKQTTEITNIDDLLSSVERDIEEVYFKNEQVFTVWGEYDGTLPAQFNSNGSTLADYRVYGSAGGVGEEVDITGLSEPLCSIGTYTDRLNLSTGILTRRIKKLVLTGEERNINLYVWKGTNGISIGDILPTICLLSEGKCSHYSVSTNYSLETLWIGAGNKNLYFVGILDVLGISTVADFKSFLAAKYAAGTPVTVWYVHTEPETETIPVPSGLTGTLEGYLIQDGTPTPQTPIYPTANGVKQADDTYSIKYGYKLDMSVSDGTTSTTTPIYIGGTPLGEDEYVDYGKQKMYKRTENEVDMSPDKWEQGSFNPQGVYQNSNLRIRQKNVQNIEPNSEYTMNVFGNITGAFCLRAANGTTLVEYTNWKSGAYTFTTPVDAHNIEFTIRRTNDEKISVSDLDGSILILLIKGSTAPASYIPYLQPTDPPIPLPALPTVDGGNIVDYAGQSAAPSRFYAKYRKEGFD